MSIKNCGELEAIFDEFAKHVARAGGGPKVEDHAPRIASTAQEQLMNTLKMEMDDLMMPTSPAGCEKTEVEASREGAASLGVDYRSLDLHRLIYLVCDAQIADEIKRRFKVVNLKLIAMQLRSVDSQSAELIEKLAWGM